MSTGPTNFRMTTAALHRTIETHSGRFNRANQVLDDNAPTGNIEQAQELN